MRLILMLSMISIVMFLAGCGENKNSGTLPYLGEQEVVGTPNNKGSAPVETVAQPTEKTSANSSEKITIVLYFGKDGYLVAERRTIPKTLGIARAAIHELIKGPTAESGLDPSIPPGTRLRDIKIKDGLATVDFSEEIQSKHPGGSAGESITVDSIVNCLTQFPSVQEVQILIEGRVVETLAGHLDISKPLERHADLIRPNQGTF